VKALVAAMQVFDSLAHVIHSLRALVYQGLLAVCEDGAC